MLSQAGLGLTCLAGSALVVANALGVAARHTEPEHTHPTHTALRVGVALRSSADSVNAAGGWKEALGLRDACHRIDTVALIAGLPVVTVARIGTSK